MNEYQTESFITLATLVGIYILTFTFFYFILNSRNLAFNAQYVIFFSFLLYKGLPLWWDVWFKPAEILSWTAAERRYTRNTDTDFVNLIFFGQDLIGLFLDPHMKPIGMLHHMGVFTVLGYSLFVEPQFDLYWPCFIVLPNISSWFLAMKVLVPKKSILAVVISLCFAISFWVTRCIVGPYYTYHICKDALATFKGGPQDYIILIGSALMQSLQFYWGYFILLKVPKIFKAYEKDAKKTN